MMHHDLSSPTTIIMALLSGMSFGWMSLPHCYAMCGPLHTCLAFQKKSKFHFMNLSVLNLGRILGYTLLGAVAGLAGGLLNESISWLKPGGPHGKFLMFLFPAITLFIFSYYGFKNKGVKSSSLKGFGEILKKSSKKGIFAVGCANSLIPCGVLWVTYAAAVGTTSILLGALLLFAYSFTISFFMQLGIFVGSTTGKKLGVINQKTLPWISLTIGLAYLSVFAVKMV